MTFQFEGELTVEEEARVSSVCQAGVFQRRILRDDSLALLSQGQVCSVGKEQPLASSIGVHSIPQQPGIPAGKMQVFACS